MADVYASIAEAPVDVQERLSDVLERRAADRQQREMLAAYLADIELPENGDLLDAGCGTGAVSRELARRAPGAMVIGIDPSPVFLETARKMSAGFQNLSFTEGDCRSLPYGNESFNAVFFHTTLSHVPSPEEALKEAFRVLCPGGILAVFDGVYTTTTLANGEHDPLQACADAAMSAIVHDRWLIQRLPGLVMGAGFTVIRQRSMGIVETLEPGYMMTIVDRGADVLAASGRIGESLADSLKNEARRRAETASFFGSIAYGSLVAHKA